MSEDTLPESIVEEAERLTRLARQATTPDEAAAYRAERAVSLAEHGYAARVREDDAGDTLVCYPSEWLANGIVQVSEIEDIARGIEVPLSGAGSDEDWDAIEAHNTVIAAIVAERHGEPHGATARALADFASNHYAKPIEKLTDGECHEFRSEYLPRNAWPSNEQQSNARESVRIARTVAREKGSATQP